MKQLFITFFIFISLSSHSALQIEDLSKVFIQSSQIGKISADELVRMTDMIEDLGQGEIIENALLKLRLTSVDQLSFRIQICEISDHKTQGFYSRGTQHTTKLTKDRLENIFNKVWDAETLQDIQEAYLVNKIEGEVFDSLVIQDWPTICLRGGKTLKDMTATLVHELVHFINDEYDNEDFFSYENEQDYVQKTLMEKGGEWDAFNSQIEFLNNLANYTGIAEISGLVHEYEMGNLETYILKILGYETDFKLDYKNLLIQNHNQTLNEQNFVHQLITFYENNLAISEYNYEVTQTNLKIYQSRPNAYVKEIMQAQLDLVEFKKDIDFYTELILLSKLEDQTQLKRIEKIKHETSLLFGHAQ